MLRFDVVVVGAGPAGSAAAIAAARDGASVLLVERGPFPGAKNMYGGVIHGRVLNTLIPRWWERAPLQRWVTRRSTMVMSGDRSFNLEYQSDTWGEPPYNGVTAYRSEFDSWLAGEAERAGATLVCSTTVTGLLRDDDGTVRGVVTDREGETVEAGVVIAGDGVNSFLAKEAGYYPNFDAANFSLGAKEVLGLPRAEIESRFGVTGRSGFEAQLVGCTRGIPGRGFLYTNVDTVAVGVAVSATGLAESGIRPEELISGVKSHPSIAPYVRGAEIKEYSAHLIPEGGYDALPRLAGAGMLVCGDAAGLCLTAGLWFEGVNFAIGSGMTAGEVAAHAIRAGDTSAVTLADYRRKLEAGFVLADHKRFREAAHLMRSDRVQRRYPRLVCETAEHLFTVNNPQPKKGITAVVREAAAAHGMKARDLARDGWAILRSFG